MSEQNYRAMLRWFRSHSAAKNVLFWVSKAAVWSVYGIYLGLLAWMVYHTMWTPLLPAALVPAAAFLVGTALRKGINRPRPYTKYGEEPLFPKNQPGCSMPSRHCFSVAAIAVAVWYVLPPAAMLLAVLAVIIAVSRVLCGVHYISDVLAGLAFGAIFALLGSELFVVFVSMLGFYPVMLL